MEKNIQSFRDLIIWQKGIDLVKEVYKATKDFPREELYGLTNQIRRAAVSIPSNIAEGHIRQHRAEFRHFLSVALGSLAEVETQVLISKELNYIPGEKCENLLDQMIVLGKMIRGLIKKLSSASNRD